MIIYSPQRNAEKIENRFKVENEEQQKRSRCNKSKEKEDKWATAIQKRISSIKERAFEYFFPKEIE